ncbi:amidohydrolase family protein [Dongia sp.]|uniref:amidohydrolase family protein n=1 Tax=Dongia sp. TaxID=1977262 RepID=UPI003751643E
MGLYRGPIIDAHHHLWDLADDRYPWLGSARRSEMVFGPSEKLAHNYLIEDYLRDIAGENVVKSVHIEAGFGGAPWEETAWVQAIADRHGFPQGIVAAAPLADPDLAAILKRHARAPNLRGIRAIASWHEKPQLRFAARPDLMDDPPWRRGLALLAERDLSLDLMVNAPQLGDVARLASDHPALRIVVNHAGSPVDRDPAGLRKWRDGLARAAAAPNVWIKISDLAAYDHDWTVESYRPIVTAVIEAFGAKRCMFGSDFPVAGLHGDFAAHFNAFRTIVAALPNTLQRDLFHDNAAAFYRL